MISAEEKETSVAVVLSFRGRNTHGENCWSSFCVHSSKENFAFISKFWSKNSFKTFFFSFKSDFHNKKRYFAKQNKARIANKWAQGSNFIDRMVISQRRDSMSYLQELEMIIYWEKATLKAITTIIPNNFEFQLCLLLQKIWLKIRWWKFLQIDEVRTDAVTLSFFVSLIFA